MIIKIFSVYTYIQISASIAEVTEIIRLHLQAIASLDDCGSLKEESQCHRNWMMSFHRFQSLEPNLPSS